MANRKVLINRHTTGNTAPTASEMFHGEIAVAHKTGEETLWTKNNADVMVPFISCAQTIAIIESKIQSSDTDVMVKTGELHLEVSAGTGDEANKFTLNTKDVQSEEEFKAYSANTKTRIDNNYSAITAVTEAVSDLINLTVTGISGDTIIVAEPVDNSTGSNAYNLTHRTGHETDGFKKIKTDAYGHVIASSAVTAEDLNEIINISELSASVVTNKDNIEALSGATVAEFSSAFTAINTLSADTEAAITAAIEGLDSSISASSAGKYFTALAIEDGKLVAKEEADIPVLSVESAGTGNVVSKIEVADHKITYQTVSVATSEDIQALSAAVIAFSAETVDEFASAFTAINDLSADTEAAIAQLSAGTIQLSADTKAAIDALSAGTLHDIEVLSGAVKANETNINTVSGDVIELSAATVAIETGLDNLSAVTLTGVSLNDTPLTVTDHVVSVPVTTSGSGIANATDSGSVADAKAVKEYVQDVLSSSVDYKGSTDDVPTGTPQKGDLWIASSAFTVGGKNVEVGDFIIYNGSTWDVIEKNLDGAITGTLTEDTVVLGDSTNSVKSLANGSAGQVLTMVNGAPAWANDPELSVVTAGTGNVVTEITASDHEITYTKGFSAASAADIAALSAGTLQLSADTVNYVKEVSGNIETVINQLSAGTIALVGASAASVFSSAKTYVDEQIDEVYASGVSYVAQEIEKLDSVGSASTTGHYLTSVTITDGKISAVGEVAVPAAVAITATTATPVDTASAVLTGVTADGTDNHNLTFGMSNKVFSAVTSDSAVTSESAVTSLSAQTSVSANIAYELSSAATITSGQVTDIVAGIQNTKVNSAFTAESADTAAKVANALSISGYATSESSALDTTVSYDGSTAKSLTFGKDTTAGKSMSMTSAGVVDVEIIDCGTY